MSDLIRRHDAIDAMYQLEAEDIETYGCSIPEGFDAKPAVEALEALPSAEPERKKGEWMEKETFDNADYEIPVWQSARCSVCGKYMTAPYQYYFTDFSYCPNCGSYNGADNEK